MPTSNDLMRLAQACADKITPSRRTRNFPSFAEVEEQCGDEYEELLTVLHEDDVYAPADLDEQERLVNAIRTALPPPNQPLIEELVDNQAAQVWLQQEGAFHLGLAVGLRLAQAGYRIPEEGEDEQDDWEREDAIRFGPPRNDRFDYDEDDLDEDEDGAPKKKKKEEDEGF